MTPVATGELFWKSGISDRCPIDDNCLSSYTCILPAINWERHGAFIFPEVNFQSCQWCKHFGAIPPCLLVYYLAQGVPGLLQQDSGLGCGIKMMFNTTAYWKKKKKRKKINFPLLKKIRREENLMSLWWAFPGTQMCLWWNEQILCRKAKVLYSRACHEI